VPESPLPLPKNKSQKYFSASKRAKNAKIIIQKKKMMDDPAIYSSNSFPRHHPAFQIKYT
jgi:hypothetical protein